MAVVAGPARANDDSGAMRVASIDWGQTQTLIAMGVPPVAAAQIDDYNTWVGGPKIPPGTRELGLRVQPNVELLSQLDLDLITLVPMYANLEPRLSTIAPTVSIGVYGQGGDAWDHTVDATRALGRAVHRPEAAERLIDDTQSQLATFAQRVPANPPALLVVQFMDARHVRVYGRHSLIEATLDRLGIDNAWQGDTTSWGFALVPLERLAAVKQGRMVVMGPIPVGVGRELAHSVLWNSLPTVADAPVYYMPAVWSFGGLPSASRFARLITAALSQPATGLPAPQVGGP